MFAIAGEEVVYRNKKAEIKLAGTLTLPSSEGPFPAVLLISGSGPTDRHGTPHNCSGPTSAHKIFQDIAEYLTPCGIAVLRVDDRGIKGGVRGSEGDFYQATHQDFVEDVFAGVEYLKNRRAVNVKQIGLIGHSQGGLIAAMAAAWSPDDIAFIVMIATPGLTGEEVSYLQGQLISKVEGASDETIAKSRAMQEASFAVLKKEKDNEVVKKKLQEIMSSTLAQLNEEEKKILEFSEADVNPTLQTILSPWFRYFLTYDPKSALMKVKCPILAMWGEKDLHVPPAKHRPAIEKAVRIGGNKHYSAKELPSLNHSFLGVKIEDEMLVITFSPEVLEIIGNWILKQTNRNKK